MKALRQLFRWAQENELIDDNPARDLTRLPYKTTGIHSWTPEEVEQFKARHPLGTMACLAMHLMLWTGVRRSDAVRLGRQHVRAGVLKFTAHKNRNRSPTVIEIPVLAELQRVIDASPTGDMTYLLTAHRKPFSAAGFGNWFRDRCNEAGLPHCSAHGLRKAGAVTAADNGATSQQIMAVFGWKGVQEVERYTAAASKGKLARDAMHLLVRRDN